MPLLPEIPPDGDAVRQVHGKHSCRRPAIQKPCVGRIAAVRIPDGREVGAAVVGAVGVGFELECRASPGDICLQQPPTVLIAKLWEIGHCILRRRDSCTLICGDFCGHLLLNAIAAFQRGCGRCGALLVRRDLHTAGQACRVAVIVKLPPAMILPPAVIHPMIPAVPVGLAVRIRPAVCVPAFLPVFHPLPILLPPR